MVTTPCGRGGTDRQPACYPAPSFRFEAAMLRLIAVLSILAAASVSAHAGDADVPKTLVIGYDEEGRVDTSEESCRLFVTQTVAGPIGPAGVVATITVGATDVTVAGLSPMRTVAPG